MYISHNWQQIFVYNLDNKYLYTEESSDKKYAYSCKQNYNAQQASCILFISERLSRIFNSVVAWRVFIFTALYRICYRCVCSSGVRVVVNSHI